MIKLYPKNIGEKTLGNVLRELRMVGLVQKKDDRFQKSLFNIPATDEGFKKFMHEKFIRYTPYQKLKQINSETITYSDIVLILKDTFKASSFAEYTWETYAKILASWFDFAYLDIMDRFPEYKKTKKSKDQPYKDFLPNKRPRNDIEFFCELKIGSQIEDYKRIQNPLYDLKNLGLIKYQNKVVSLTDTGKLIKSKFGTPDFEKLIANEAVKTTKIAQASNYFFSHPECSRQEFGEGISNILDNISSEEYRVRSRNILYSWAKFVHENQIQLS